MDSMHLGSRWGASFWHVPIANRTHGDPCVVRAPMCLHQWPSWNLNFPLKIPMWYCHPTCCWNNGGLFAKLRGLPEPLRWSFRPKVFPLWVWRWSWFRKVYQWLWRLRKDRFKNSISRHTTLQRYDLMISWWLLMEYKAGIWFKKRCSGNSLTGSLWLWTVPERFRLFWKRQVLWGWPWLTRILHMEH